MLKSWQQRRKNIGPEEVTTFTGLCNDRSLLASSISWALVIVEIWIFFAPTPGGSAGLRREFEFIEQKNRALTIANN